MRWKPSRFMARARAFGSPPSDFCAATLSPGWGARPGSIPCRRHTLHTTNTSTPLHMGENRNLLVAFLLSAIVIFGWEYFVAMPQMKDQQHKQATLAHQEKK